jgi:ribosomal protein L7Ae-like RNA K-turn-binding protein
VGKLASYLINIANNVDQDEIVTFIELLCENKIQYNQKALKKLLNYAKNEYKSLSISYLLDYVSVDIVHDLIVQTLTSGTP